ncbi:MAG: hypothetical protein ACREJP_08790 [Candidatus Methylomirabilales bacterium]
MRTSRYGKIEKDIVAHDGGSIWERWRYGRLLLVDDTATTAAGNLQHGVLARLITVAERNGIKVSEREIRYRVQCARTYPTRDQIGKVIADLGTWFDLIQARFPEYPAPEDARPYDPRETQELLKDHDSQGARLLAHAQNQVLFDSFDPTTTTLAELARWTDEQDEITARFVAIGLKRRQHLADLTKVAHGDTSMTWAEAERLLAEGDD